MLIKNVGPEDKAIRIVAGIAIALVSYFLLSGAPSIMGYIVSVILLMTANFRFCGIYTIFGINTCKIEKKRVKILGSR